MDRYEAGKVKPVEASAKLDGVYARATRDGIFTKSGAKMPSPHIEKRLKRYFKKHPAGSLEGELWRKKAGIEAIAGEARSGNTGKLRLHVYPGQPSPPLPFGAVRRVKGRAVKDDRGVQKALRKALRKGHEGVVVRGEDGVKRKLKPMEDAEYQVSGVRSQESGRGKTVLALKTAEGRPFKVQAGVGAAAARAGDQVQVRYSGLTRSGKPKAAVAVRVRNEKDFSMKRQDAKIAKWKSFEELSPQQREQVRRDRRALLKGALLTGALAAGGYALLRKGGGSMKQPPGSAHAGSGPLPPAKPKNRVVMGRMVNRPRPLPPAKTPKAKPPTMTQAAAANNERKGGVKRLVKAAELKKERAWGALKTPSAKRLAKLHPSVQQEYLRLDKAARSKGVKPLAQHADHVTAAEARAAEKGGRLMNRRKLRDYREKKNFHTAFVMTYLSDGAGGSDRSEKLKNAVLAGGAAASAGAAIYSARQIGKAQKTVQVLAPQLTPKEIARAVGAEVSGKAKRTLKGYFPTFIKGGKKVSALLKKKMFEEKPMTHEELVMRYGAKQAKRMARQQEKKRGFFFETAFTKHFGNDAQLRREGDNRYADPLKVAAKLERAYTKKDPHSGEPIWDDVPLRHAQVLKGAYRKASKIQKGASRGGALAKDVVNVARGKARDKDQAGREKKREWEKPWFKRGVRNVAITGALLVGAKHVGKNPQLWKNRVNKHVIRPANRVAQDAFKEWEDPSDLTDLSDRSFATPASRILGKFMGPSAAMKKAAEDRGALVGRLKAAAAKGNDKAAGMVNRARKHAAMKEAKVATATRRQKDAVRTLKKGAGIAAGGAVLGGTAMKLHADQPEDRKTYQGARFRNALMGAAAGSFLGGALHAGKSGFRGARLGAAAGGLIGAVSNPRRKQAIEDLPTASFEARGQESGVRCRKEFAAKLSPEQFKSAWRHHYKKLKKLTRGGKMSTQIGGYLPGDSMAKYNKSPLVWRGTDKGEVAKLADNGRFVSKWQNDNFPGKKRTYVAGDPLKAKGYAVTASAGARTGRGADSFRGHFGPGIDAKDAVDGRIVGLSPKVLKRADHKIRSHVGDYAATAPIRGGVGAREVRAMLKPEAGGKKWKPVPLGDIQKRDFQTPASALFHFDEIAADAGWDVRDPRGRSARVFAPGARQRYRRPKEWHEKKENRDKLALALAAAAGVGGFALGRKLKGGKIAKAVPGGGYHHAVPMKPRSAVRPEGFRPGRR